MSNRSVFHAGLLVLLLSVLTTLAGCGGTHKHAELAHYPTINSSSSGNSSAADAHSSGSTIRYESIRSNALQAQMGFAIYLPAGYDPAQTSPAQTYPVLYMMYGYGGNQYSMFNNFMSVNRTADKMITANAMKPMILVVPDYKNSFAVNSTRAQNPDASGGSIGLYEDYSVYRYAFCQ
jgi:enterochelin esterase-like enzyme